jgi:polysaccharide pyruvyl transferase WcaK-like protein
MRILFDMAVYDMRNKGNVAMLQAALERIGSMWPDATLEVISVSPHILRLYCPKAISVIPDFNNDSFTNSGISYSLMRRLPVPVLRIMLETREAFWRSRLKPRNRVLVHKNIIKPNSVKISENTETGSSSIISSLYNNLTSVTDVIHDIDLFVATGGQYMSDDCRDQALDVLGRMEASIQQGIPTVMVGQGIGPITDPLLLDRAREVLPRVSRILIREYLTAPQLLEKYGVKPTSFSVTGDDAIEMSYQARSQNRGDAIGVSLRAAPYTQVNEKYFDPLRDTLKAAAAITHAPFISIPISYSAHELDDRIIRQILPEQHQRPNGLGKFSSPREIIKKVGSCRIVISGTFHAALFALSQGIPAIGLVKSTHYIEKFEGLANQFGPGCQIIYFDEDGFKEKLLSKIEELWDSAEQHKPRLLNEARRQINLGHAAYQQLYEFVDKKKVQVV